MIPLTYTLTISQETTLRHIETLRASLLSLVIPVNAERSRCWNSLMRTIQIGFSLNNQALSIAFIEQAIHSGRSKARNAQINTCWEALQFIREYWPGTSAYITYGSYTDLSARFHTDPGEIKHVLTYLASGHEHPVIHAAITMAALFQHAKIQPSSMLYATTIAYGNLCASGYTCRDLYSPLASLISDRDSFHHALNSITLTGNLNHWILFVTSGIESSLVDAVEELQRAKHSNNPKEHIHMHLTNRQRLILNLLEKPGVTINNGFVQRKFAVSQITASRDLIHLTNMGLITPHGKSRATSYTKNA